MTEPYNLTVHISKIKERNNNCADKWQVLSKENEDCSINC